MAITGIVVENVSNAAASVKDQALIPTLVMNQNHNEQ